MALPPVSHFRANPQVTRTGASGVAIGGSPVVCSCSLNRAETKLLPYPHCKKHETGLGFPAAVQQRLDPAPILVFNAQPPNSTLSGNYFFLEVPAMAHGVELISLSALPTTDFRIEPGFFACGFHLSCLTRIAPPPAAHGTHHLNLLYPQNICSASPGYVFRRQVYLPGGCV